MSTPGLSCALTLVTMVLAAGQPPTASAPAEQRPSAPPRVASSAGGPASEPEPAARIVRLDAVVTDRHGKPILSLGPHDFEVVENGVVQKLHAVELRHAGKAADAAVPLSADDERAAATAPSARVFALLLDEYHVSAGPATERVRESLAQFVDEELRSSDLVAVLRPLDSVTDIRFTRDRDAVRDAVRSFSGRKDDYEPRTDFERKYIGRAPAAVVDARSQIVLSGLRALTARLDELDAGRSAIVLVTEGFAGQGRRRTGRRVADAQGLVRAASRANVAIYTFDPAESPHVTGGDPTTDPDAAGDGFLDTLAVQTGGASVRHTRGFADGLRRVARDLDAYYVITYTSSHSGDGRFYDVQVRSKAAGATVRARSGYWAPVRTEEIARSTRSSTPARLIRRSPLIQTWLGLSVSGESAAQQVTFTWIPAELPRRQVAGLPPASVVGLRVRTSEGAVLFEGEVGPVRAGMTGVRESAAFFEAGPGRIQFDLLIFAADGSQIDEAAHDVEIPDPRRGDPQILPPQVFGTSSAREFRLISSDPAAAPTPSREFRRTERLLVRVPTHSPSGAAVALTARILNRTGQPLRAISPMRPAGPNDTIQFDLPLSWLAPGEYSVELTATTPTGSAKELVRIRITG